MEKVLTFCTSALKNLSFKTLLQTQFLCLHTIKKSFSYLPVGIPISVPCAAMMHNDVRTGELYSIVKIGELY